MGLDSPGMKEKKDTGRIKSNFTLDVKFNKIRSDYGWSFGEIGYPQIRIS